MNFSLVWVWLIWFWVGLFLGVASQALLPRTWPLLLKLCVALLVGFALMIGLTYLRGGSLQ